MTKPTDYVLEKEEKVEDEFSAGARHSLQRKAALVEAGPVNHKKNVYYVRNPDFDLNKTIFQSVDGLMGFRRLAMKTKLGNNLMWNPEAVKKIEEDYESFQASELVKRSLPMEPDWENYAGLIEFMRDECNFSTEHADGSFMDHLYFCRDFSKTYYNSQSPRILFLHSIMGVGTNLFPMDKEKVPKLGDLLTEQEFHQVAAFPSILRLLTTKTLIDDLMKAIKSGKIGSMKSISFFRVIDNEKITMNAADFWVALNLQLIHQMDFLPCSNWCSQIADPLFQVFTEIFQVLDSSGKLDSGLKFSMESITNLSSKDEFGMPKSVASTIYSYAPKSLMRGQIKKSIQGYSKKIGHDLSFEIEWEE